MVQLRSRRTAAASLRTAEARHYALKQSWHIQNKVYPTLQVHAVSLNT